MSFVWRQNILPVWGHAPVTGLGLFGSQHLRKKLYVIRYIDHYARFVGKNKGSIFAIFPFGNSTIMGNIYDHANLMEATK